MRTTITFLSARYFPVSSVGKNGKQRCLGEVVWVWTLTVRGLQIVKINMLLRTQNVAGSWIADNVFSSRAALRPFDTTPDCARTTPDKPGSVSRVNRGQGGQSWSLLAVDTHDLYNLTCNKTGEVSTMLLSLLVYTLLHPPMRQFTACSGSPIMLCS